MLWLVLGVLAMVVTMRVLGKPSAAERGAVAEKLKQGALILDVRTAGEFAGQHYAGATNIPVQELSARIAELGDTNRAIIVYCRSGRRAASAKQILNQAGFKTVINAGGLQDMP